MEDTLQIGDRVMVNKLAYTLGDIERGDVIVFNGVDSWSPEIQVADTGEPADVRRCAVSRAPSASPPRTRRTTSSGSSDSRATTWCAATARVA